MNETPRSRSMLLGLIVAIHGAIIWQALFASGNPVSPVAQAMEFSLLPPGDELQPLRSRPEPPMPKFARNAKPQETAPTVKPAAESAPQEADRQQAVSEQAASTPQSAVLPPRFDAVYLNNPAPAYPSVARRTGTQGKVLLRVFVSAEGVAAEVLIHRSSGSLVLDEAALAAVRKWNFVPAMQDGRATAAWVQVPVDFRLN